MEMLNQKVCMSVVQVQTRDMEVGTGETGENFAVGTRVRVKLAVVVYHHPEHKGQGFDLIGQEGEVASLASEWQGKEISANFPYIVKFAPKFSAHLQASELEKLG
jgi:hypothetical protein